MTRLSAAIADGLAVRGTARHSARLAAEAAVSAFSAGFERWASDEPTPGLAQCITDALSELRAIVGEN
jgi:hypothetical protein